MPMKLPTVAGLRSAFPDLTAAAAEMIRSLMRGDDDARAFVSAAGWYIACHHKPDLSDPELILRAVSDLADELGVEQIRLINKDGEVACLYYVNTGDTYRLTLAYDCLCSDYIVTSWGAWVEAMYAAGYEEDNG